MRGLLQTEHKKYRGAYIVSLSQLGMLFPVMLVLGMFLLEKNNFIANNRYDFETFSMYVAQLFIFLVGPIITSFIASFSIYYEYQQGTMKNLLSSPHSRGKILLSKFAYVCAFVLVQYVLAALLCAALAAIIGIDVSWSAALQQLYSFALVGAVTLVMVPMMMLITLVFRSFVPAMVFTVIGTAANILALNWDKSYLSPWAIPGDIMLILQHKLKMDIIYPGSSLAVYMSLALIAAFVYFIRADQASS